MNVRNVLFVGLTTTALAAGFLSAPASADGLWNERTFSVPMDGTVVSMEFVPGAFSVIASGTGNFGDGQADANCQQQLSHGRTEFGEWYPEPLLNLMVKFNYNSEYQTFWTRGDCHADHVYQRPWTCYVSCTVSFYFHDSYYGDNSGALTVEVDRLPN